MTDSPQQSPAGRPRSPAGSPQSDYRGGPLPADPLLADLAATALAAARVAADVLVGGLGTGTAASNTWSEVTNLDTKVSATDMVSDVDRAAEAAVAAVLAERRPDDGVVGEEGTNRPGSTGVEWVVDPLDGTTNYLFGIPQFSVSIAAEIEGRPVAGVVIDPSRGETWTAVEGEGAWLDGRRCRVARGRSSLETALLITGFGYRLERRRWQGEVVARILPAVRDIRRMGSAALDLAWTGGGRYDAYYEWGLNRWDLSAGRLIVTEAGGRVEVLGNRLVVATTPELWGPLVELLEQAGALDAPPGPEPGDTL